MMDVCKEATIIFALKIDNLRYYIFFLCRECKERLVKLGPPDKG